MRIFCETCVEAVIEFDNCVSCPLCRSCSSVVANVNKCLNCVQCGQNVLELKNSGCEIAFMPFCKHFICSICLEFQNLKEFCYTCETYHFKDIFCCSEDQACIQIFFKIKKFFKLTIFNIISNLDDLFDLPR